MIVVSDAGPLIALAKVDRLNVLQELFDEVYVPLAVHRELFAKLGPESSRLEDALQGFLQIAPSPTISSAVGRATSRLHPGEREAIALAVERKALLLADDQMGRSAARRLGLAVTGVIGVLLRAKEAGLLPSVHPVLIEMRQCGYWLSDEILILAERLAGES
jgi:predicted nucleic acid-binding protein